MQDKKFWESKKFIAAVATLILVTLQYLAPELVAGLGTENQAIAMIGSLLMGAFYVLAQAGNDNERIKLQEKVESEARRLLAKYDEQVVKTVQAELTRLLEGLNKE